MRRARKFKVTIVFAMVLCMLVSLTNMGGMTAYAMGYELPANGTGFKAVATTSYNDAYAWEVLSIVNDEREAQGLSALSMDSDLMAAAKIRSKEIVEVFDHTRPDGTSCFTVSDKAYGENIAAGYETPSSVMTAWMNSDGHRANILRSGYKSMGISCYSDNGYLYWVQLFGIAEAEGINYTVYNGVDYSAVYDYDYYISKYPDIKNAFGGDPVKTLAHFVNYGMSEGRQASENFDVQSYKARYADLRNAFGNNLKSYYMHYINSGKKEGRIATGTVSGSTSTQTATTVYNGVDYSAVYDFNYYIGKYSDIKAAYGSNPTKALAHFVNYGMAEGRQASESFDVQSYKSRYADLRNAFGNNLKSYYMHYINSGKKEGRIATGTVSGSTSTQTATTVYNGVDYSAVYDFNYYIGKYSDIKAAYGSNPTKALAHFVNYGMAEGRQASANFNVQSYKSRYADLRNAFGNNLKAYYMHYINCGKSEGRTAK